MNSAIWKTFFNSKHFLKEKVIKKSLWVLVSIRIINKNFDWVVTPQYQYIEIPEDYQEKRISLKMNHTGVPQSGCNLPMNTIYLKKYSDTSYCVFYNIDFPIINIFTWMRSNYKI